LNNIPSAHPPPPARLLLVKLSPSNVPVSPAGAGAAGAWMPGLTVRSVLASLLAMLIVALAIQMSTVDAGMEPAGDYGLPIPGVVVLVVLVVLVGVAAKFLKWQLLARAEMMAVFYCMVIAAPLMTQGFWHRVLGITATIPRGADFKKMAFFSDRLWPHGPNVLRGAFNGPVILEGTANSDMVSKVVRVRVSDDASGGIVPGEPYLVSFEAHAEGLGAEAFYFVRSRAPGRKDFQEALRSREPAKVDRLHPDGFVLTGAYGVIFTDLDGATEVEVEFGLAGVGRLEIRDPRLFNVSALELAYTGQQVLAAGEFDQLALADRAGVRRKPENLFSPEGLVFLLQAGIPVREWATPLATWGGLAVLLLAGALAINVIMRRQWVEGERYALPLTRIPSALIGEPDETGNIGRVWALKVLWVGVGLGLLWGMMRGFHFYNPDVPSTEIKVDLGPYFGPAWGGFWHGVTFQVVAVFVAVAVFVELNVLMSLVAGFLAFRALYWLGFVTGWAGQTGYPYPQQQQTGAFLVYGFLVLILARKHLWQTVLEVFRPVQRAAADREILSYRAAYLLLVAVFCGAVVWAWWVGVSGWGMTFYVGFMLLICLVASKFRAEAGVPYGYFTPANSSMLLILLGGIPVFGPDLVLLTFVTSFVFSVAVFFLIPGAQLEMMELGRRYRMPPRQILGVIIMGVVGGLVIGGWVFLSNAYAFGGDTMRYAWAFETKAWYFADYNLELAAAAAAPSGLETGVSPSTWAYAFGGGVVAVLAILRQIFAGFWLHPIGFILGPSYLNQIIWGSILVAWLLRYLFVRFGGGLAVRTKLQPFFIGIFLGAIASWSIWFVYGLYLRSQGVQLIYGALP